MISARPGPSCSGRGRPFFCLVATIDPEFITIDVVAEMVGVHPRTIRRRWYEKTFPPPIHFGRKIKWPKLDVENYRGKY